MISHGYACAGDFNEILFAHEQQFGGNDRGEWMMEGFRDVISYAGFTDLGFRGLPYTWDNRRDGYNNIKVRLDRALADGLLLDVFGDSSVMHIQTAESDHCTLLIRLQREWMVAQPALSGMKICGEGMRPMTRWCRPLGDLAAPR